MARGYYPGHPEASPRDLSRLPNSFHRLPMESIQRLIVKEATVKVGQGLDLPRLPFLVCALSLGPSLVCYMVNV